MKRIRNIVPILIILFTASAQSTEYYVAGVSGNDNNPGTIGNPWKTVGKANKTLQTGDIVYIRAGTYYVTGSAIDPINTGTPGKPITYSNYNSERVEFVGNSDDCHAINLNSDTGTIRNYIIVKGFTFTNFYKHLWILRGSHNEISHCTFIGMYERPDGAVAWQANAVYRGAQYNHIHDCTFAKHGKFTPNDEGVVFYLGNEENSTDGTSYNLIENNHMYHGGHCVIGISGHHNVIRNNYFHNERWSPYAGENWGNRVLMFTGYPNDDERNLFEGNRVGYGGECADDEIGGSGGTIATSHNIIRRNMYYHNDIYGSFLRTYGGRYADASNNHIYNNIYWHNGYSTSGPLKQWWNWEYTHAIYVSEGSRVQNNIFKNNIFYNNRNYYGNRVYYDNRNYYGSQYPIIEAYPERDLPDLQTISHNWMEDGDPKFIDISGTPDPLNETQFDFHLQSSSSCIDAGDFLTTITSSRGSGTQFQVADAGYFMDGWGIIDGDAIQLEEQSQTATITNVDYSTNTLTVNTNLTWTNGQGISLAYKGLAPDIGAHEAGTAYNPLPHPPQN